MFKMKKILLVGGALFLLAGCTPAEPEFEQNEDPIVEGFSMYIIGSHWNKWKPESIKEADSHMMKKQNYMFTMLQLLMKWLKVRLHLNLFLAMPGLHNMVWKISITQFVMILSKLW